MQARVRRRYAAERRFRLVGLAAVGLSVLFLAFLLYTMAAKGIGGFSHYEARLPIDFAQSDLFLDPATLRGPDAEQTIASADIQGAITKAAVAAYGADAEEMFGESAVRKLTRAIVDNPDLLSGRTTLWLTVSSNVDIAAKGDADAKAEAIVQTLESKDALKRRFNADFLTSSDSTDASSVGVWGAL